MKRLFFALLLLCATIAAEACTSAIVSGKLTANGRPMLWKNRDTNDQNNRVERVKAHDGLYEFVALFDARDTRDTAAWMGFNEKGFAIMNTASYNLNIDKVPEKDMDKEGLVMRIALERCVTVDDFEQLLNSLPQPRGVEANFGVLDAQGNAAYFETGNYSCTKFDLNDEPSGIMTRTNYSYSGIRDKGYGYIREANEKYLLKKHISKKDITPAVFTEEISRTFYHSLLGMNYNNGSQQYVVDQDFIARSISTASMVIEGVLPGEDPSLTTAWIALGYPPCADVFMCNIGEGGVPKVLNGTGKDNHSPQCDVVNQREAEVFSIKRGSGKSYINLHKLYNDKGTGYCQVLTRKNMQVYAEGYKKLAQRRAMLNNLTTK